MKPIFKIVANDKDITALIADRLVSLSVTDEAGRKSDVCEIVLDDRDHRLKLPPPGGVLTVSLGFDHPDRDRFLSRVGAFVVDEFKLSGPPFQFVLRAKAFDMLGSRKSQKDRSWDDVTLADIAHQIGQDNDLIVQTDDFAAAVHFDHVDQPAQDDFDFLLTLAERSGAIATLKQNHLLVLQDSEGKRASGKPLPLRLIRPQDISRFDVTMANRDHYRAVIGRWHDYKAGRIQKILLGDPAGPVYYLPQLVADEDTARREAEAELKKQKRSGDSLSLTLLGDPRLIAERPLALEGFRAGVNGYWIIKSVRHNLSANGFVTSLQAERPNDDFVAPPKEEAEEAA